jgi:hypothetical protein
MFSNRKLVLIIVLLLAISFTGYFFVVYIPAKAVRQSYEGAKEIGRDIRDFFQFTPEVTVNNIIILEQQTPIMELATLKQTFTHQYQWTNTWMKSTKKIKITGTMEAKAGYDLNRKFKIEINDDKAIITLPHPQLLSLEPQGDIRFEDENGIWNWVKPEDRSLAINAFTSDAKLYASKADFVQQARKNMEEKLIEILKSHGKTVEIRYDEIPTLPENHTFTE